MMHSGWGKYGGKGMEEEGKKSSDNQDDDDDTRSHTHTDYCYTRSVTPHNMRRDV